MALLGHSWGGLLALEYAIRHPGRVSHLILMNTAPVSSQGWDLMRARFRALRRPDEQEQMQALASTAGFQGRDPDALTDYYRIYFRPGFARYGQLERLAERLRTSFSEPATPIAFRIGDRLFNETLLSAEYDLSPKLAALRVPTLVIHGDQDFIPLECAAHVAETIPGAQLAVLNQCGHFSYMEAPEAVREAIVIFLGRRDSS
jgi:proline iminopeptidase